MTRTWLLGLCAALCLGLGADALRCSDCVLKNPEETCKHTCEARGVFSGCMAKKIFAGYKLVNRRLTCYAGNGFSKCKTIYVIGRRHYEYHCCSDEDFCNSKL